MAFQATEQLLQREAALLNARAEQQYNRYMADLARNFGIAEGNLNANLEGRGIFRSGEAGTARARLSAENQALKSAALQDLEYQKNMNQINLLKQLASLQASSAGQNTQQDAGFDPGKQDPFNLDQYRNTGQTLNQDAARRRVATTTSGMGSGRPRQPSSAGGVTIRRM